MMLPVAGAATTAMPADSNTMPTTTNGYEVSTLIRPIAAIPTAIRANPPAIVRPAPIRSAIAALRGETSTNIAADGSVANPASSGE